MLDTDKELSEIREYLLHRSDEEGRGRFEERFVADPEFRELALAVEEELLDDYLAGLLSADERDDFVKHYLSIPRHAEELELSRALMEFATRDEAAREQRDEPARDRRKIAELFWGKSWLPALAFSLLLVAGLAITLSLAGRWRESAAQGALNDEVARLNMHPPAGESVYSETLTAGLSRAPGQGQKVTIPPGLNAVQLLLNLPRQEYQSYETTLRLSDGPELFTVSGIMAEETAAGRLLKLRIPARALTPEDYVLTVKGIDARGQGEVLADYFFRVVK